MPAPTAEIDIRRGRDSSRDLLARIDAAAADACLGAHLTRYWWTTPLNIPRAMALLLPVGTWLAALFDSSPGPAMAGVWGVLALAIGIPLVGELLYGAAQRSRRLDLFEHGLVMTSRGRPRAARYADTTVLRRIVQHGRTNAPIYTSYRYTLTDTTGTTFTITNRIERHGEWNEAIQQKTADAQFPAALAALDAGQRLDFGGVWVTERQLGRDKDVWPWTDVIDLRYDETTLHMVLRNRFQPVGVGIRRIPNFRLFVALAQYYAPAARQSG